MRISKQRSYPIQTRAIYWFVTLFAALNFFLAYVRLNYQPFSFSAYAHGGVEYPQQSRILMAILFARTEHSRLLALICAHAHPPLNEPLKLLMVIVAFCMMVIAIHFVRLFLEYLTEDRKWSQLGSLLVIFMAYFQYILASDSPFLYPLICLVWPSSALVFICFYEGDGSDITCCLSSVHSIAKPHAF